MPKSRKIVMMLVALLGAILLWLYVVTVVAPEATTRVSSIPINIDGTVVLGERGLIITDQDVSTLSVDLSTSRVNLTKLNAETIRVNADASKIREPGIYALTCTVTFPDTVRSSDVDLIRKSVESVTVTVTRLDTKTLPVDLVWTGAVKDGYLLEAEKAVFDPEKIVISGSESDVSQVERAVVEYDVSDLEETVTETLDVKLLNADGEEVSFTSENTTVSATQVSMTLPMSRTKELTLKLDTIEGGGVTNDNVQIDIEPKSIRVKGSADVIDQLEDEYVLDTLDLSVLPDEKEMSFNLTLPNGVTNMSGETRAVAVIRITGVSYSSIPISDIRLINAPAEYRCESSTRIAYVTVRGGTEEIREIRSNENNGIYIEVDLTDYTNPGVYTVPGVVVNESHPNISVSASVEIGILISEPEPETEPPTENEG